MATTARTWAAAVGERPTRSRPLLRPPAMSTTEAKPRDGGQRGVGGGGLRVVVPAHAVGARRRARPGGAARRTSRSACADAVERRRPPPSAVAAAASALATSWGRARHSSPTLDDGRRRRGRRAAVAVDGGSRPDGRAERDGRGRVGLRVAHHDRVVGVGDRHAASGAEVAPRCGPWPPRSASSERVDVEVVRRRSSARWPTRGREVSACGRGGTTTPRPRTRRRSGSSMASTSGTSVLPTATAPPARRLEHRGDERGDRGLAVGAGDGERAGGRPTRAARSNSLSTGTPAAARGGEHRDGDRGRRGSAARASTAGDERRQLLRRRAPRPAPRRADSAAAARGSDGMVVDDGRRRARGATSAARHGLAGDAEARTTSGRASAAARHHRARPRRDEVGVEDAEGRARCTGRRGSRTG